MICAPCCRPSCTKTTSAWQPCANSSCEITTLVLVVRHIFSSCIGSNSEMTVDTLVVGIGSDHGDDRVGWLVADALQTRAPADVSVRHAKTPLDLLDWLDEIR